MSSMLPGSGSLSHYRLLHKNSGLTYSFSKKKIKNVAIRQGILLMLYKVATDLISAQKMLSPEDPQIA